MICNLSAQSVELFWCLCLISSAEARPTRRRSRSEQNHYKHRRFRSFKPTATIRNCPEPEYPDLRVLLVLVDKPNWGNRMYEWADTSVMIWLVSKLHLKIWTFGWFIQLELSPQCLRMTFIKRTLNALKVTEQKYHSRDWNTDVSISCSGFCLWKILLFLLWNCSL